jgi:hypothetical protein
VVAQTNQPYAFTNDNPLNATDPLGLCSVWNPFCDIGAAADQIAGATVQIVHVAENPIVAGVFLGVIAVATGGTALGLEVGFIAGESVGASAGAFTFASLATSSSATALDAQSCVTGRNSLACVGTGLGAIGSAGTLGEQVGLFGNAAVAASAANILVGTTAVALDSIQRIGAPHRVRARPKKKKRR